MSVEQNIQIARNGYADFMRGDIAAVLANMDENVVWVAPEIAPGFGGTYQGKAGVGRFFQHVAELWDFQAFEPREYIASGDQVVVLGHYAFTSRATGRSGKCDWAMVWKIQNGKLVHFQEYTDSAVLRDALAKTSSA